MTVCQCSWCVTVRVCAGRTLKQNVDISAPIMSRFDLFFVVLDEGDQAIDYNIARHIVNVHTGKASYNRPEFSLEDLQLYIRYARTMKPTVRGKAHTCRLPFIFFVICIPSTLPSSSCEYTQVCLSNCPPRCISLTLRNMINSVLASSWCHGPANANHHISRFTEGATSTSSSLFGVCHRASTTAFVAI